MVLPSCPAVAERVVALVTLSLSDHDAAVLLPLDRDGEGATIDVVDALVVIIISTGVRPDNTPLLCSRPRGMLEPTHLVAKSIHAGKSTPGAIRDLPIGASGLCA